MLFRSIKKEYENRTTENENISGTGCLQGYCPMTWTIDFLENIGIVKIKTSGPISLEDKKKLSAEALAAGRQKRINSFLVDNQESHLSLSILEIDQLPKIFREAGFVKNDKVAILVRPDTLAGGVLRFIENVFYLSSLQIRIFSDADKAASWLKEKI